MDAASQMSTVETPSVAVVRSLMNPNVQNANDDLFERMRQKEHRSQAGSRHSDRDRERRSRDLNLGRNFSERAGWSEEARYGLHNHERSRDEGRERSRQAERERSRDVDRERSRDVDRERGRDREQSREVRGGDRERSREAGHERSREARHERSREATHVSKSKSLRGASAPAWEAALEHGGDRSGYPSRSQESRTRDRDREVPAHNSRSASRSRDNDRYGDDYRDGTHRDRDGSHRDGSHRDGAHRDRDGAHRDGSHRDGEQDRKEREAAALRKHRQKLYAEAGLNQWEFDDYPDTAPTEPRVFQSRALSNEDMLRSKHMVLMELQDLVHDGAELSRKYDMDSDFDEMHCELVRQRRYVDCRSRVDSWLFYIRVGFYMLEVVNTRVLSNMLPISGIADYVSSDTLDRLRLPLKRCYYKYVTKAADNPLLDVAWILGGTIGMFMLKNSLGGGAASSNFWTVIPALVSYMSGAPKRPADAPEAAAAPSRPANLPPSQSPQQQKGPDLLSTLFGSLGGTAAAPAPRAPEPRAPFTISVPPPPPSA